MEAFGCRWTLVRRTSTPPSSLPDQRFEASAGLALARFCASGAMDWHWRDRSDRNRWPKFRPVSLPPAERVRFDENSLLAGRLHSPSREFEHSEPGSFLAEASKPSPASSQAPKCSRPPRRIRPSTGRQPKRQFSRTSGTAAFKLSWLSRHPRKPILRFESRLNGYNW